MSIDPAILEQVRNNELTELDLSSNSLTDNDIQQLAEAIPPNSTLTTLYLGGNNIGDEGTTALAQTLPQCVALTSLYLSGNNISGKGATALAQALPHCPALTRLGLSHIGDEGTTALAQTLPQCVALTSLYLSGNNISGKGATALAQALPQCAALKELDLSYNHIGNEGATALAQALPHCTALTILDLSDCHIGNEGVTALVKALPQCPTLTKLYLYYNHLTSGFLDFIMSPKTLSTIQQLCEEHKTFSVPLIEAASQGDVTTVQRLVQEGAAMQHFPIYRDAALQRAEAAGHMDIVALFDPQRAFNAYLVNQEFMAAEALITTLTQLSVEQRNLFQQQLIEAYVNYGIMQYDQQQWSNALSYFNKALSYQPDNRQAQDYRERCQQAIIAQPLAADIASLQTTIESLTSDTQALQATTTDLTDHHRHLAEQQTTLANTLADNQREYEAKLEAATEQLAAMVESAIHQSHGELTHRVGKLDDAVQQEKKRVHKTITRIDEQLNHLQDAEAKQDVDIADIQQQLEQLTSQKTRCEAELDRLNHNQEHLQQQLNTAMETLQEQLDNIEDNHALHLEEQRQAIHDTQQHIEHLTTQLTQLAEQHQNTATQVQLNDIRNQVNELYADYARKQHHLGRMSLLQNDPSLVAFYCTVQVKLKGIFLAYQSIASHLVEPAKSIIGKIITGLGSVASLIPDPSAGLVAQVITKLTLLGEKQYTRRQAEHISTIVLTTSGSEDLARYTAWLLTQCYELQIRYLTTDNGAKQLATGAVGCILYALKYGMLDDVLTSPRINTTEDIARALVQVIAHVDIRQGTLGLRNQHLATLDDPVATQAAHYWTDNGALREAGIYDAEEKAYYHIADSTYPLSRPKKYDYRLGTLSEAQRLASGGSLITRTQPVPSQIIRYDTTRYLLQYEAMMAE